MTIELSIIGGGVMAEAILSRLLSKNIYTATAVLISEPSLQRRNFLTEKYQVKVTADNQQAWKEGEIVLLAIKPQIFHKVVSLLNLNLDIKKKPLVISILAGMSLEKLEKALPDYPVIRTMPNTPATIGEGITAIAPGKLVTSEQITTAKKIFTGVGKVVEVAEYLMDGVTGLSGSGPAYVALMIEALTDGGVAVGLPRAIASQLALQTIIGTAKLIEEQQLHPAELKDRVTSPGGTTIAGVAELERLGFRSALIEAVKAAKTRSQELGKD